ncbi:MAG: hypothetical protein KAT56_04120, partial [Sedimentisphaerales bacterium]|nr:hypothetical protein [Sedimentisphaerales bacterium]
MFPLSVGYQYPLQVDNHFPALSQKYPLNIYEIWFSSKKLGDFIKVLCTKPWSLTLYGLRHVWYNTPAVMGDSPTQEC